MFLRSFFGVITRPTTTYEIPSCSVTKDIRFSMIARKLSTSVKDFGIIGAGAAGMAAAIHARYDGFSVSVFESRLLQGGSYSNTPLIQNLPGFPTGVSGASLSSGSIQQLEKLGGTYFSGTTIEEILRTPSHFILRDTIGRQHPVCKIILATGVAYRKLQIPGSAELEGRGIYYEVDDSILEEVNRNRSPICIYGGGNSAGQAALFYESVGAKVTLVYRSKDLTKSMSQFLIQRISRLGIDIFPSSTITRVEGHPTLSNITVKDSNTGDENKLNTHHLFAMIGGIPSPLPKLNFDTIALDERGYILVKGHSKSHTSFATSVPNIYAAGDITSIGAGRILLAQAQGVAAFVEASRNDEA